MTEPTPNLPATTAQPAMSPDALAAILGRLESGRDALIVFNAVRDIALNPALLSSVALRKIRGLYADFDQQHPNHQPKGQR